MLFALALSLIAQAAPAAPSANCERDPSVVKQADPTLPKGFLSHLSGTTSAIVAVTLDASGVVTKATIYKSSGDATMDNAAIDAAKRSTYAPGEANCRPSGGTFGVEFAFAGDAPVPVSDTDCPRDARVSQVVNPGWPNGVRVYEPVLISVELVIDPDGSLESASIVQSSGNMALDQSAFTAARQSTYLPKLMVVRRQPKPGEPASQAKSCVAVKGKYLFRVTFDPNS